MHSRIFCDCKESNFVSSLSFERNIFPLFRFYIEGESERKCNKIAPILKINRRYRVPSTRTICIGNRILAAKHIYSIRRYHVYKEIAT